MKDFTMRVVSAEDRLLDQDYYIDIAVHKMRNSSGHAHIKIEYGGESIRFVGLDCEERARKLIELMEEVIAHPCTLLEREE